MNPYHFYIVDVFAEKKYSGNQLAVFLADEHLTSGRMQTIARETNFAETTFILSTEAKNGGYDVRIFTPGEEVPFAGHPTLGTSFVLRNEILKKPVNTIYLNLKAGQIPVTFGKDEVLWMRQNAPEFGPTQDAAQMVKLLSLDPSDIDDRYPVQGVSTGLPFTIVPLKNLKSLKKARLAYDYYDQFLETAWARAILMFCPAGYEVFQQISVRMFAPVFGIVEDPATGSGNGCLAAYLVKHCYFNSDTIDITAAQGYEINRPSTLYLKAYQQHEKIVVNVGGKVVKIAEGDFV